MSALLEIGLILGVITVFSYYAWLFGYGTLYCNVKMVTKICTGYYEAHTSDFIMTIIVGVVLSMTVVLVTAMMYIVLPILLVGYLLILGWRKYEKFIGDIKC